MEAWIEGTEEGRWVRGRGMGDVGMEEVEERAREMGGGSRALEGRREGLFGRRYEGGGEVVQGEVQRGEEDWAEQMRRIVHARGDVRAEVLGDVRVDVQGHLQVDVRGDVEEADIGEGIELKRTRSWLSGTTVIETVGRGSG